MIQLKAQSDRVSHLIVMDETNESDLERWRALSATFREAARKITSPEGKRLMAAYAADYERLVKEAETLATRRSR